MKSMFKALTLLTVLSISASMTAECTNGSCSKKKTTETTNCEMAKTKKAKDHKTAVREMRTKDEFKSLLNENANNNKLIVVDFFAVWCGPCKGFEAKYDKLSTEYRDAIFVKIDVDNQNLKDTIAKYGISSMPTFKGFKNKKVIFTVMGADKLTLEDNIKRHK